MATLDQIKSAASAKIEQIYPIYKQINILDSVYGVVEADKFRAFRDAVRERCHQLEPTSDGQVEPFEGILELFSDIQP